MTFINPFISPSTDGAFIQLITNGNVTLVDGVYNGTTFQPYIFQAIGTNTHTFRLPDPSKYSLQIGVEFIFMNTSTQSLSIQAPDSSFVCSVLPSSTIICTMTSLTSTSSSWTTVRSNVPSSGILPLTLGGTGSSVALTTPAVSHYAAYDSSLYLRANQFISPSVLVSGNQTPSATGLSSVYIYESSGSTFTLPLESLMPIGQSVTILNNDTNQNEDPITIALAGHTDNHYLPPGFGVTYIMSNPSGSYQAWLGLTFQVDGFGFGEQLSFTPKHTYGAGIMNIPFNGDLTGPPGGPSIPAVYYQAINPSGIDYYLNQPFPFNYQMTKNSSTTTVINSAYSYHDSVNPTFPQVFLPDVSTIPLGSTYRVYFNNQFTSDPQKSACQYQVRCSKSMNSSILQDWEGALGGQPNNCTFVCISNDPSIGANAWSSSNTTTTPNSINIVLDVISALFTLVPFLGEAVDVIGGAIAAARVFGIIAEDVSIAEEGVSCVINLQTSALKYMAQMSSRLTTITNTASEAATVYDDTGALIKTYNVAGSLTTPGTLPSNLQGIVQLATRQTVPPYMGLSTFMRLNPRP